jgi:hypothetical protein
MNFPSRPRRLLDVLLVRAFKNYFTHGVFQAGTAPRESRATDSFSGEAVIRLVLLLARFFHSSRQVNNTRENPAAAMG